MKGFVKDPNATLDYTFNWEPWLSNDTITSSTWILDSGVTEESSSFTDTTTTAFISGGVVGESYTVTNRISTLAGRTDDRSITLRIRQR